MSQDHGHCQEEGDKYDAFKLAERQYNVGRLRLRQRGSGKENLSGQVQFPGLPQLLRVKPGTVAGPGAPPDTGVAGGDLWSHATYSQMETIS